MNAQDLQDIQAWLTATALRGASLEALVEGLCAQLIERGIKLRRVAAGSDLLHPVHFGVSVIWQSDAGRAQEEYYSQDPDDPEPEEESEEWLRSPFYHLITSGEQSMCCKLDHRHVRGKFPMLDRFQDEGASDYVATVVGFGEEGVLGDLRGVAASYLTADPGGFSEDEIKLLIDLADTLALAYKSISTVLTGRTVMRTYLGADAAARVLNGDIRRGRAETVDAVLWFSDLRDFTRTTDTIPRQDLMEFLNSYTECSVDAVHRHGGQVLKFMGDGILAMFPRADNLLACDMALDAAIEVFDGVQKLNHSRASSNQPVTELRIGLHRGEVFYGNIGSRERLDFTVIGPAVNEVARIENMCRVLDQPLVASSAFAESKTLSPGRLVSLGRYALRGVSIPQTLFTLDPENTHPKVCDDADHAV